MPDKKLNKILSNLKNAATGTVNSVGDIPGLVTHVTDDCSHNAVSSVALDWQAMREEEAISCILNKIETITKEDVGSKLIVLKYKENMPGQLIQSIVRRFEESVQKLPREDRPIIAFLREDISITKIPLSEIKKLIGLVIMYKDIDFYNKIKPMIADV